MKEVCWQAALDAAERPGGPEPPRAESSGEGSVIVTVVTAGVDWWAAPNAGGVRQDQLQWVPGK